MNFVMGKLMTTKRQLLRVLVVLSLGLTLSVPVAVAQSEIQLQAQRQLEFSKNEIAGGSFERALSSASAAFRLDPTLYDALVYKALAYEGLGELRLAEGLLTTYMDIRGDLEPLAEAEDALGRVSAKLGSNAPPQEQAADAPGEDASSTEETAAETSETAGEESEGTSSSGDETPASSGSATDDEVAEGEVDGNEDADPAGEDAANANDQQENVGDAKGEAESTPLQSLLPSDAMLARLHLKHQRAVIKSRIQIGGGLMVSGLGLASFGGVMMGLSASQYSVLAEEGEPTDQATAIYAGSMGMVGAGLALAAVGVPVFIKAQLDSKKLSRVEAGVAVRPQPRLELMAQGIGLRF
jgi:tetratricopeptide (TPR) repeat protein